MMLMVMLGMSRRRGDHHSNSDVIPLALIGGNPVATSQNLRGNRTRSYRPASIPRANQRLDNHLNSKAINPVESTIDREPLQEISSGSFPSIDRSSVPQT
ncbi:hypothetical protein Q8A67_019207 [Cirrhinus molitorella]|uniref:Uncharacterized protein n=1 Tax=Cirrhinus molitorella TaxID=172907 RepID=A0AA88PL69_9TELE|nr:hypothetical protein Q8A67_019207 [Cirrhinus molitorella]